MISTMETLFMFSIIGINVGRDLFCKGWKSHDGFSKWSLTLSRVYDEILANYRPSRQRTSLNFVENQPMHRNRNCLQIFCHHFISMVMIRTKNGPSEILVLLGESSPI